MFVLWGENRWRFSLTACTGEEEVPPPPNVCGGMTYRRVSQKGKQMGGGKKVPWPDNMTAAHLFSPFFPVCGTPFRKTRQR